MGEKKGTKVGLFNVCYEIGGEMPGAPLMKLNLGVFTPDENVNGIGTLSQTTNPPLDFSFNIHGDYSYMCVMPKNCHILVVAKGYPIIKWPKHAGIGPVIPPIVELRMVLTEDWKSGSATYRYMYGDCSWNEVKNAPVKAVNCNPMIEE